MTTPTGSGGVPVSGAPQVGVTATAGSTGSTGSPGAPGAPSPPGAAGPGSSAAGAGGPTVAGGAAAAQPLRPAAQARRARLVVRRVDPWSVLKFTLLFSICLLIVFVVAVAALYFALQALGVFDSVNEFVRDLTQANSGGRTTGGVEVPFTATRVIGVATVIGLINVVLITAISTLGAFLYNLCADIVGGIEVTLAERE
ncbi:MAG TPA: DUF3566 domain-containing protein [Mycobacteriales bacterium]